MKDWQMYYQIQKLKALGFRKNAVKNKLGLNPRTVAKYWDMSAEEFQISREAAAMRAKKPDEYRSDMIEWLKQYPDMSAAQMFDWLEEKYGREIRFKERTMRSYIYQLRLQEDIPKASRSRQYEAVDELPPGYQAQVDMGQIWLKDYIGKRVCLYCFAMVLAHSRYKFVYWQTVPFTTATFIEAHEKAFAFFGGRTQEIVYDQDKVLAVSENNGDIIYTAGFQNYLDIMKFRVFLCHGADPESKGQVESVVKYVKYNFADHRTFTDITDFNEKCLAWLERRGNGKEHETTKKIPTEVFALEKEYLQPVPVFKNIVSDDSVTYGVRKDNTVLYKSNRYRVPKGTYRPNLRVKLVIDGTSMVITDAATGEIYARHTISDDKGKIIPLNHSDRELNKKLVEVYDEVLRYFTGKEMAGEFLEGIRKDKPRYFKDQLNVILKTCIGSEKCIIDTSLAYCLKYSLYSAGDFKAATEYYKELSKEPERASPSPVPGLSDKYRTVQPKVRDINEYRKLMEG